MKVEFLILAAFEPLFQNSQTIKSGCVIAFLVISNLDWVDMCLIRSFEFGRRGQI